LGVQRGAAVGLAGEDGAGRVQLRTDRDRMVFGQSAVLAQDLSGLRIEDDAALLVGLGVLFLQLTMFIEVDGPTGW
jgi:hypothetical protein